MGGPTRQKKGGGEESKKGNGRHGKARRVQPPDERTGGGRNSDGDRKVIRRTQGPEGL